MSTAIDTIWHNLEPGFRRITVTPQIASLMLASNTHNRKVSPGVVSRYAAMMRLGQWRCAMADPITFDSSGVLQDGQHRLHAVVQSEVQEVDFWVAYGADPEDFHVIGTGKRRSVADVLGMAGYSQVNVRAAAARQVLSYGMAPNNVWAASSLTPMGLTEVSVADEAMSSDYDNAMQYTSWIKRHTSLISATTVVAHAVLVGRYSEKPEDLPDFIEHLSTGAGLELGNPILTLRNWYLGDNARAGAAWGTWGGQRRLAIHIRAWNGWVSAETLKQLKFNQQNLPMPGVK